MKRSIGVFGASVTLIGLVVGISIYILPGTLAVTTGPAVAASYGIASLLALLACVVYAQIGSVMPVSGASLLAIGRLVSPFCGFASVSLMIGGAAVAVALLAYGFADYVQLLWPGLDRRFVALGLVLALGTLNLVGLRANVLGQGLLVLAFLVGLSVFTTAGLTQMDVRLLTPFAPHGWQPVLAAAIPAYFSFAGFMVIIDIGGEVRDPARTIPRALAISFVVVAGVYLLVSVAVVGTIPWQRLEGVSAPVGEAAARVLPHWVATLINLSAVAAAASSVNGLLLGYSRDVHALARIQILPRALARVSAVDGVPRNGVLCMLALSLLALALGDGIREFATLIAVALLVMQLLVGVAALLLPYRMADEYVQAAFRIPRRVLQLVSVALVLSSLVLLWVAFMEAPRAALVAGVYLSLTALYYLLRRRQLQQQGIEIGALIRNEVQPSA